MENHRIPSIRFKGFSDPWEQRKYEQIFAYERPDKYIVKSDKYVDDAPTPVLTANKGFVLGYTEETNTYKNPCIIFDDFTLDNKLVNFDFMVKSSAMKILTAKPDYDLNFSYSRLQSTKIEVLGHARHYISVVQKTSVYCPKIAEQKLIGTLFDKLDSLITLHQRKCQVLINTKKALLEKMFPSEHEAMPKIRFKGFSDAWEQRKFGDELKLRRGLTYSPSNISQEGIRVLRSSNINEEYFVISEDDVFVKQECVNIPFCKNGDILITAANGSSKLVGKHAVLQGLSESKAVHGGFMILGESNNSAFINASMSSSWYVKFINLHVAGGNGAIGNLNKNDLENQRVLFPTTEEQTKIGELFDNLDHLITLHQRKCEKLKNMKKSLLEKMFI